MGMAQPKTAVCSKVAEEKLHVLYAIVFIYILNFIHSLLLFKCTKLFETSTAVFTNFLKQI